MTTTNTTPPLRCGDYVRHRPSGQEWLVAWAEGDWLSWFGWPPGQARVDDCDVLERCSDEDHAKRVQQIVDSGEGGNESSLRPTVLRLYRPDLWSARPRSAACVELALFADMLQGAAKHFGDASADVLVMAESMRRLANLVTADVGPYVETSRTQIVQALSTFCDLMDAQTRLHRGLSR